MFRSLARDVAVQRTLVHHRTLPRSATPLRRLISTPNSPSSSTSHSSEDDPLIPPQSQLRKHKLDLRPAPIKGATLNSTPKPNTALHPNNVKPPQTAPSTKPNPAPPPGIEHQQSTLKSATTKNESASLEAVKESARRDIEDAEAHGILAPPPPDAGWARRTLHKGIELAKFYYRGVRLIFIRRSQIAQIRARVRQGGLPLTRAEFRLIQTQKKDVNKVVPFLFIALLLEEVIPLIAIYAPFMLPSTCILPGQQTRIDAKRSEKAVRAANLHALLFAQLRKREGPQGILTLDALKEPGVSEALCGILRLSALGGDWLRTRRIRQHLKLLSEDDVLIAREGGVGALTGEKEVREALEERGVITHGMSMKVMQKTLKWWLDAVGSVGGNEESRRLLLLVTRQ